MMVPCVHGYRGDVTVGDYFACTLRLLNRFKIRKKKYSQ